MGNWTLYLLLVFLSVTVLVHDSYGLTVNICPNTLILICADGFYPGNSVVYGGTINITVTPTNTANAPEISINNVVVTNSINQTLIVFGHSNTATFTFNAFGPIPYLGVNAMVAGSPYTVNGISTNSIYLAALGDVANSVGNVLTNSITITQASPQITFPSPEPSINPGGEFVYNGIDIPLTTKIVTYNNQLTANFYVNGTLVNSFITQNTIDEAAAGSYIMISNTLGNGNYTAKSITKTIEINKSSSSVNIDTPGGGYLYLPDYDTNSVIVWSLAANKVTANIPAGTGPSSVAITPDGQWAYVADYPSNTISVINTSNNVVANTIQLTSSPTLMAIGPNGNHLYVGSESGKPTLTKRITYITTIYTSNNLVANILNVPSPSSSDKLPLSAMSVSNSGKHLYSISYDPSCGCTYFTIMDTATDAISSSSPGATGSASGYSLAMAPNNDIYFSSSGNFLTSVTPVFSYYGVSSDGLHCPSAGKVLIKNNGYWLCGGDSASITVFNTITDAVLQTISLPPYALNMTTSQDGQYIYINYASGHSNANEMSILNTITDSVANVFVPSEYCANADYCINGGIAISPNYVYNGTVPENTVASVESAFGQLDTGSTLSVSLNGGTANTYDFNALSSPFSYTYPMPSAIPGNYVFTVSNPGNANYIATAYTYNFFITKGLPDLSLPNFPSGSFVYGTNTITANIATYGNQLPAEMWAGNTLLGSFTTGISNSEINAGSPVVITVNTPGNGNYLPASISNTVTITKATPSFSLEFQDATNTIVLNSPSATSSISLEYGTPFTINTLSDTINNQLDAYLFINNILNKTVTTSNSLPVATLPPGTYTFTFNSPGNNNYLSFDPSITVTVLSQSVTTSSSGSQGTLLYLNDNITMPGSSESPVATAYIMESGNTTKHGFYQSQLPASLATTYAVGFGNATKEEFYQSQLPASLTLYGSEIANISFACSVTMGSTNYIFTKDIEGIGYNAQCDRNYTVYGGNFVGIYASYTPSKNMTSPYNQFSQNVTINLSYASVQLTISKSAPGNIIFLNSNAQFKINTESNTPMAVNITIKNSTYLTPSPPKNYTKILALTFSTNTTAVITANATVIYGCSRPANGIKPFILTGGGWKEIQNFTVDAKACALSFQVPKNSTFSVMQYLSPTAISSTNTTAAIPPSNALPSNVPVAPANVVTTSPPQRGLSTVEYIVATAAVLMALYFILKKLGTGQKTL